MGPKHERVISPQRIMNNTPTTKTLQRRGGTLLGSRPSSPGRGQLGSREAPFRGLAPRAEKGRSAPSAEQHSEHGTALSNDVDLERLGGPLGIITVTCLLAKNESMCLHAQSLSRV